MNRLKKIISWVVLSAFTIQSTAYAAPEIRLNASLYKEAQFSLSELTVPEHLGRVDEWSEAPAGTSLIFHISDAHGNYEAQKNIENLIRYLHREEKVDLVFLEGASGPLNPELFQFSKDKNFNARMADFLMKEGKFSGAEAFLIQAPRKIQAYGVEDITDYRKDIELFRAVLNEASFSKGWVQDIKAKVRLLEDRFLGNELRGLIKEWRLYRQSQDALLRFGEVLKKTAEDHLSIDILDPATQEQYPNFLRILKLRQLERKIDLASAKKEQEKLLVSLGERKLDENSLKAFQNIGKEKSPRHILERIVQKTGNIDFRLYPQFTLWAQYLIFQTELDSKELFDEVDSLSLRLMDKLAVSTEEKKLMSLILDIEEFEKILQLEISRKEYSAFLAEPDRLLPSALVQRMEAMEGKTPSALNEADIRKADAVYRKSLEFYFFAKKREDHFIQTVFDLMKKTNLSRSVVITGGFHAEGVRSRLKEKNVTYASIVPRITQVGNSQEIYVKAMLGENPQGSSNTVSEIANVLQLMALGTQDRMGAFPVERVKDILRAAVYAGSQEGKSAREVLEPMTWGTDYMKENALSLELSSTQVSVRWNGEVLAVFDLAELEPVGAASLGEEEKPAQKEQPSASQTLKVTVNGTEKTFPALDKVGSVSQPLTYGRLAGLLGYASYKEMMKLKVSVTGIRDRTGKLLDKPIAYNVEKTSSGASLTAEHLIGPFSLVQEGDIIQIVQKPVSAKKKKAEARAAVEATSKSELPEAIRILFERSVWLWIFDKDDTLLKSHSPIEEATSQTLNGITANEQNVFFSVISGGKVSSIDRDVTSKVPEAVQERLYVYGSLGTIAYAPKQSRLTDPYYQYEKSFGDDLDALIGAVRQAVSEQRDLLEQEGISQKDIPLDIQPSKMNLKIPKASQATRDAIAEEVILQVKKKKILPDLKVAASSVDVDISLADKEVALRHLLKEVAAKRGVSAEELLRNTAAVGDSANDFPMLNAVAQGGGLAVWVGSSDSRSLDPRVVRVPIFNHTGTRAVLDAHLDWLKRDKAQSLGEDIPAEGLVPIPNSIWIDAKDVNPLFFLFEEFGPNALRFVAPGTGKFSIKILYDIEHKVLRFIVKDNGQGLPLMDLREVALILYKMLDPDLDPADPLFESGIVLSTVLKTVAEERGMTEDAYLAFNRELLKKFIDEPTVQNFSDLAFNRESSMPVTTRKNDDGNWTVVDGLGAVGGRGFGLVADYTRKKGGKGRIVYSSSEQGTKVEVDYPLTLGSPEDAPLNLRKYLDGKKGKVEATAKEQNKAVEFIAGAYPASLAKTVRVPVSKEYLKKIAKNLDWRTKNDARRLLAVLDAGGTFSDAETDLYEQLVSDFKEATEREKTWFDTPKGEQMKGITAGILSLEAFVPQVFGGQGGLGMLVGDWIQEAFARGAKSNLDAKSVRDDYVHLPTIPLYQKAPVSDIEPFGYQFDAAYRYNWGTMPDGTVRSKEDYLTEAGVSPLTYPKGHAKAGQEIVLSIPMPNGQTLSLKPWIGQVDNGRLLFLDSDLAENNEEYRKIFESPYREPKSGEPRFLQQWALGIGFVQLMDELNVTPTKALVMHSNETATIMQVAGLVIYYMKRGYSYDEAVFKVRNSVAFTTHTLVPAGFDTFYGVNIPEYVQALAQGSGLANSGQIADWLVHGKKEGDRFVNSGLRMGDGYNMGYWAVGFSWVRNAVSQLNATEATTGLATLLPEDARYPGKTGSQKGYEAVTNGVARYWFPRWIREKAKLEKLDYGEEPDYASLLTPENPDHQWLWKQLYPEKPSLEVLRAGEKSVVTDEEILKDQKEGAEALVGFLREKVKASDAKNITRLDHWIAGGNEDPELVRRKKFLAWRVENAGSLFDPAQPIMVWARRVVEYKRMLKIILGEHIESYVMPEIHRITEFRKGPISIQEADQMIDHLKSVGAFDRFVELLDRGTQFIFAGKAFDNFGRSQIVLLNRILQRAYEEDSEQLPRKMAKQAVFFPGYTEEVASYFARGATTYMATSEVPLEASGTSPMKPLKPVIATHDGYEATHIVDDVNGWLAGIPKTPPTDAAEREEYFRVEAEELYKKVNRALDVYQKDTQKWIEMRRAVIFSTFTQLEIGLSLTGRTVVDLPKSKITGERVAENERGYFEIYAAVAERSRAAEEKLLLDRSVSSTAELAKVEKTVPGKMNFKAQFFVRKVQLGQRSLLPENVKFMLHWGKVQQTWNDIPATATVVGETPEGLVVEVIAETEINEAGAYGGTFYATTDAIPAGLKQEFAKWQAPIHHNARVEFSDQEIPSAAASLGAEEVFRKGDKTVVVSPEIREKLTQMTRLARKMNVELEAHILLDEKGVTREIVYPDDETKIAVIKSRSRDEFVVTENTDYYMIPVYRLHRLKTVAEVLLETETQVNAELKKNIEGQLKQSMDAFAADLKKVGSEVRLYSVKDSRSYVLDPDAFPSVDEFAKDLAHFQFTATTWFSSFNLAPAEGRPLSERGEVISIHSHPNENPAPPSAVDKATGLGDIYMPDFFTGGVNGIILDTPEGDELFLLRETDRTMETTYEKLYQLYWYKSGDPKLSTETAAPWDPEQQTYGRSVNEAAVLSKLRELAMRPEGGRYMLTQRSGAEASSLGWKFVELDAIQASSLGQGEAPETVKEAASRYRALLQGGSPLEQVLDKLFTEAKLRHPKVQIPEQEKVTTLVPIDQDGKKIRILAERHLDLAGMSLLESVAKEFFKDKKIPKEKLLFILENVEVLRQGAFDGTAAQVSVIVADMLGIPVIDGIRNIVLWDVWSQILKETKPFFSEEIVWGYHVASFANTIMASQRRNKIQPQDIQYAAYQIGEVMKGFAPSGAQIPDYAYLVKAGFTFMNKYASQTSDTFRLKAIIKRVQREMTQQYLRQELEKQKDKQGIFVLAGFKHLEDVYPVFAKVPEGQELLSEDIALSVFAHDLRKPENIVLDPAVETQRSAVLKFFAEQPDFESHPVTKEIKKISPFLLMPNTQRKPRIFIKPISKGFGASWTKAGRVRMEVASDGYSAILYIDAADEKTVQKSLKDLMPSMEGLFGLSRLVPSQFTKYQALQKQKELALEEKIEEPVLPAIEIQAPAQKEAVGIDPNIGVLAGKEILVMNNIYYKLRSIVRFIYEWLPQDQARAVINGQMAPPQILLYYYLGEEADAAWQTPSDPADNPARWEALYASFMNAALIIATMLQSSYIPQAGALLQALDDAMAKMQAAPGGVKELLRQSEIFNGIILPEHMIRNAEPLTRLIPHERFHGTIHAASEEDQQTLREAYHFYANHPEGRQVLLDYFKGSVYEKLVLEGGDRMRIWHELWIHRVYPVDSLAEDRAAYQAFLDMFDKLAKENPDFARAMEISERLRKESDGKAARDLQNIKLEFPETDLPHSGGASLGQLPEEAQRKFQQVFAEGLPVGLHPENESLFYQLIEELPGVAGEDLWAAYSQIKKFIEMRPMPIEIQAEFLGQFKELFSSTVLANSTRNEQFTAMSDDLARGVGEDIIFMILDHSLSVAFRDSVLTEQYAKQMLWLFTLAAKNGEVNAPNLFSKLGELLKLQHSSAERKYSGLPAILSELYKEKEDTYLDILEKIISRSGESARIIENLEALGKLHKWAYDEPTGREERINAFREKVLPSLSILVNQKEGEAIFDGFKKIVSQIEPLTAPESEYEVRGGSLGEEKTTASLLPDQFDLVLSSEAMDQVKQAMKTVPVTGEEEKPFYDLVELRALAQKLNPKFIFLEGLTDEALKNANGEVYGQLIGELDWELFFRAGKIVSLGTVRPNVWQILSAADILPETLTKYDYLGADIWTADLKDAYEIESMLGITGIRHGRFALVNPERTAYVSSELIFPMLTFLPDQLSGVPAESLDPAFQRLLDIYEQNPLLIRGLRDSLTAMGINDPSAFASLTGSLEVLDEEKRHAEDFAYAELKNGRPLHLAKSDRVIAEAILREDSPLHDAYVRASDPTADFIEDISLLDRLVVDPIVEYAGQLGAVLARMERLHAEAERTDDAGQKDKLYQQIHFKFLKFVFDQLAAGKEGEHAIAGAFAFQDLEDLLKQDGKEFDLDKDLFDRFHKGVETTKILAEKTLALAREMYRMNFLTDDERAARLSSQSLGTELPVELRALVSIASPVDEGGVTDRILNLKDNRLSAPADRLAVYRALGLVEIVPSQDLSPAIQAFNQGTLDADILKFLGVNATQLRQRLPLVLFEELLKADKEESSGLAEKIAALLQNGDLLIAVHGETRPLAVDELFRLASSRGIDVRAVRQELAASKIPSMVKDFPSEPLSVSSLKEGGFLLNLKGERIAIDLETLKQIQMDPLKVLALLRQIGDDPEVFKKLGFIFDPSQGFWVVGNQFAQLIESIYAEKMAQAVIQRAA